MVLDKYRQDRDDHCALPKPAYGHADALLLASHHKIVALLTPPLNRIVTII
jgi:hypothetical protein